MNSPVATCWFYAIRNYFASGSLIIERIKLPKLAKYGKYDVHIYYICSVNKYNP